MTSRRPFVASCLAALLAACTSVPAPPPAEPGVTVWHPVLLPGKRATDYGLELKDGRHAVAARADRVLTMTRGELTEDRK